MWRSGKESSETYACEKERSERSERVRRERVMFEEMKTRVDRRL